MREHARRWLLCAVLAFAALVALPQAALAEAKPVWRLYNQYNGDTVPAPDHSSTYNR